VEFFADRNLGRYDFPETLRAAGLTIHAHDDHFAQDAPDTAWLPSVAARGWVVLSADRVISRDPFELAAVMLSGAAMFYLVGGAARAEELARNFVNTLEKVTDFIERNPAPYIAKIYRPSPLSDIERGVPGSVRLLMDYSGWLASRKSIGFRP
jgi:hypothetical protein